MKRLRNFLRLLGLAPAVNDVMERLYPESHRPHRAQPTATYEPDLRGRDAVEPFYVVKGKR